MRSLLKEIREREGIPQVYISRTSGLSDTTIRAAERGKVNTPTTLNRIVKAVNRLGDTEYELSDIFPDAKH